MLSVCLSIERTRKRERGREVLGNIGHSFVFHVIYFEKKKLFTII